jgi:hypothetical protein
MRRKFLKCLFCAFELGAFGAAYFLLRADWRNPAGREYENVLGLVLGVSFIAIAAISFAIRRTDKDWANAGVVTILALLMIGMLSPAL